LATSKKASQTPIDHVALTFLFLMNCIINLSIESGHRFRKISRNTNQLYLSETIVSTLPILP
jgi:hypothetical protein